MWVWSWYRGGTHQGLGYAGVRSRPGSHLLDHMDQKEVDKSYYRIWIGMGSLCFTGFKPLLQLRRACLPAIQRASQPAASFFRIITFRTWTGTSFNFPWAATSLNSRKCSQRQGHSSPVSQPTTHSHLTPQPQPIDQSNNQSNGSRIVWTNGCRDRRDLE